MGDKSATFSLPHNMLRPGMTLAEGRFTVASAPRLGRGQFAEVYLATDASRANAPAAVKVESEHRTCAREARVMRAMSGRAHFPELLLEGNHEGMPFLAMELVGENLADVRARRSGGRFSQRTTSAIAVAMLDALESMHGEGFVHRDIKPGNVCVGNGKEGMKRLYLIDFGLARKFTDDDGNILPEREDATFRGTTTYASVYAHAHKEQSARDDLYSALYIIAEAHEGVLPWKAGEKMSKQEIEGEKQRCVEDPRLLCPTQGCPPAIERMAHAIAKLQYGERPDYAALRSPFEEVIRNSGDAPLDWETQVPSPNVGPHGQAPPPPPPGNIPVNVTYADVAAERAQNGNITGRKRERDEGPAAPPGGAPPPPQPSINLVLAARREPSKLPARIADTVRDIASRFPPEETLAVSAGLVSFLLERCLEGDPAYPRDVLVPNILDVRNICFDGVGELHKRFPDMKPNRPDGRDPRDRDPRDRDRDRGDVRFGGGGRGGRDRRPPPPRRDDFRSRK